MHVELTNMVNVTHTLSEIVVLWGPGTRPLQEVRWDGTTIWSGNKYYSAYLEGLSGDLPAGSTRTLDYIFGSGPISWLSFQAGFDNDCYVSYHDPNQPTPPPLPTDTPTPTALQDPCAPYILQSRAIVDGDVRLTFLNQSPLENRYVYTVHIYSWPSPWGALRTVRVKNNTKMVNAPAPPVEVTGYAELWPTAGTIGVVLNFQGSATDADQVHGYILVDNGCQVQY